MGGQVAERDRTRKKIKKARRRQLCKRLGSGIAVIALIIGFVLTFQVRDIVITGNEFLTEAQVRDYIKEQGGTENSLVLTVRARFGDYPVPETVRKLTFGLKNPWTILVHVTEKEPVGYIEDEKRYIYFDEEGLVLGITKEKKEDVVKIEGMDAKGAGQGEKIQVKDKAVFRYIVQISDMLGKAGLTPDRIVCDGEEITLYFGKIRTMLGSGEPEEKIAQLPAILPKLEGQEGTLHLEYFGRITDTIHFEKKEEAKKE